MLERKLDRKVKRVLLFIYFYCKMCLVLLCVLIMKVYINDRC